MNFQLLWFETSDSSNEYPCRHCVKISEWLKLNFWVKRRPTYPPFNLGHAVLLITSWPLLFPSLQVIHSIVTSSCLRSCSQFHSTRLPCIPGRSTEGWRISPFLSQHHSGLWTPKTPSLTTWLLDPPTLDSGGPSATTSYHDVSRNKGLYLFKGNEAHSCGRYGEKIENLPV